MRTADRFNKQIFITKVNGGKSLHKFTSKKAIFRQGDPCDSIFYIESGQVKLVVVSKRGKEAVVAILGPGDFLGEECLGGQTKRISTATPLSECTIARIE